MKAATVFLILLGLVIAALGGFFTVLMWKSYQRADAMRSWPQVEALVLSSAIEEWQHDEFSPMEYRLEILYGYEWKGKAMTGERLTARGNPFSNKRVVAEEQLERYPAGKKIIAFVYPADPSFTVLRPDSKAPGYSIWFPLLFVFGGLGIAAAAIRRAIRPGRP